MQETSKHILMVDDDPGLRELVANYLGANGFVISSAADGAEMRQALSTQAIDLVILDLMLPDEDGLSLLSWLRGRQGPPVIIVSARGDEVDRVVGLEMGADDYLAKPFAPRELLARIRAVLRRIASEPKEPEQSHLAFGPYRLHVNSHALTCGEREIALTNGEFNLLRVLLEHPNQVLSRDHLISLLKGYDRSPFDRSIDIRVTRLRRKIEPRSDHPVYLRTIWGEGYLFAPDGEEQA